LVWRGKALRNEGFRGGGFQGVLVGLGFLDDKGGGERPKVYEPKERREKENWTCYKEAFTTGEGKV